MGATSHRLGEPLSTDVSVSGSPGRAWDRELRVGLQALVNVSAMQGIALRRPKRHTALV